MQHWHAWFSDRDDDDKIFDPAHWRWNEVMETQQRFWTECAEAGQIWLSWWVSVLPPMNWPPVGVVLPPGETKATGNSKDPASEARSARLSPPADTASAAAHKQRSAVARHH